MLLDKIDRLILESKSSKKRGYTVKNITDKVTGESKMIKFTRNPTPIGPNATKKQYTEDNIDTVNTSDRKGRVHPSIFNHEVGHIMRNPDNRRPGQVGTLTRINDEKTAWQYVKSNKPDEYDLAKKDKILQNTLGGYVNNMRNNHISKHNSHIYKQIMDISPPKQPTIDTSDISKMIRNVSGSDNDKYERIDNQVDDHINKIKKTGRIGKAVNHIEDPTIRRYIIDKVQELRKSKSLDRVNRLELVNKQSKLKSELASKLKPSKPDIDLDYSINTNPNTGWPKKATPPKTYRDI